MRVLARLLLLAGLVVVDARTLATTRTRAVKRAREILASANGVVTADEVADLKSELQEAQAEDDTNEGIIEALLAKQKTLKAQLSKLQKERGTTGFVQQSSSGSATTSSDEVEDLRRQLADMTSRAEANTMRADKAVKELVAARDTITRLQEKTTDGEGRALPKHPLLGVVKSKLALLQSQDQDTTEQNGALATIQQFSRKMFMESQEVGEQMQTLNDRLAASQHREKETKAKLQEAKAQMQAMRQQEASLKEELASRAATSGQVKSSLTHSLSTVDQALIQGLKEVRSAEKALKAGGDMSVSSDEKDEMDDLKDQNLRLRRAGSEVMQKYDLLRQNCEKQQKWINAEQAQQKAEAATSTTVSPAAIADAH